MQGYFYNSSTRNYIAMIGKLFSNIYVVKNKNGVPVPRRVPVSNADQRKYIKMRDKINSVTSEYNIARVDTILPRINIRLVDIVPNAPYAVGSSVYIDEYGMRQYSPTPVRYLFEINVLTNSMSDQLQITEQFLPYFRTHFTISMKEIMGGKVMLERDLLFNWQTTSVSNDVLGDVMGNDLYDWSSLFELSGYVYPPQFYTKDQGDIIKTIYLNFKGDVEIISSTDMEEGAIYESVDMQIDDIDDSEDEWLEKGSVYKQGVSENEPLPVLKDEEPHVRGEVTIHGRKV